MLKYPTVTGTSDNKLMLVEDYTIKGIRIPKGFKSDGLTLKTRILRLFVNRYSPKFQPFFFLHDYLCSLDNYIVADSLGERVLFKIEKSIRTKAMMKLIKLYHWGKYGRF